MNEFVLILLIVIFLITAVIGKFILDRQKMLGQLAIEGGVQRKYSKLIEAFLTDPDMRINSVKADCIQLVRRTEISAGSIDILHSFDKVHIQWTAVTRIGKLNGDFEFSNQMDQLKMAEIVSNDIATKFQKLSSSFYRG